MTLIFRARAWCIGDDIDTDLILPIDVLQYPRLERPKYMFRANRPGWSEQVRAGDILIAGKNFGMGSGRPAAQSMKDLGIACVLADSLNGLFFRNCVNFALPALEVPDVSRAFEEGDPAEIDFFNARVTNLRTGQTLAGTPWPPMMQSSLRAGGLVQKLESEGLLHPEGWMPEPGTRLEPGLA